MFVSINGSSYVSQRNAGAHVTCIMSLLNIKLDHLTITAYSLRISWLYSLCVIDIDIFSLDLYCSVAYYLFVLDRDATSGIHIVSTIVSSLHYVIRFTFYGAVNTTSLFLQPENVPQAILLIRTRIECI